MKIDKIDIHNYNIYVYYDLDDIEEFIVSLKDKLKLQGFYKVYICNKKYGLFIQLVYLEEAFYADTLNLKIVELDDMKIYFKTEDYYLIKDFNKVYYYQNYYYVLIDDLVFDIYKMIEFGEFIFGDLLVNILKYGIIVK